jgi:4-azaleucine resistance transporter AzlC
MKLEAFKKAFPYTIPIFLGYLFLGIAFGVLLASKGFSLGWAVLMSSIIYAGSMQFVAVNLIVSPFNLGAAFLMTLLVNARHIFYGHSLLEKFRFSGKLKQYMIFSLTDETFSLLFAVNPPENVNRKWFMFFIALLDQSYWILGGIIGNLAGTFIHFNSTGIDFAMTAVFIAIFVEQWEKNKNHAPAILGVVISIFCLVVFGQDTFILFAMLLILLGLLFLGKKPAKKEVK